MKKQLLKSALIAVAGVGLLAGSAFALPAGTSLQTVFNNITQVTLSNPSGNSNVNVISDFVAEGSDSNWAIGGTGGSVSTIVIELAGNAGSNYFGIYDSSNPANMVTIFDGSAGVGSLSNTVSFLLNGNVLLNNAATGKTFAANSFGYFLGTQDNGIFYSNTSLNSDGTDHMFAYEGKGDLVQVGPYAAGVWGSNEYILAWEDLKNVPGNGFDGDYDDFVVMVESVTPSPVPEPTTMLLFGSGLLGLASVARRRRNN